MWHWESVLGGQGLERNIERVCWVQRVYVRAYIRDGVAEVGLVVHYLLHEVVSDDRDGEGVDEHSSIGEQATQCPPAHTDSKEKGKEGEEARGGRGG